MTLDLDLYTSNAPIIDNLTSTYTVTPQMSYDFGLSASKWTSSPSITTGSYAVTTGTPAMSSITTASTITIGDQSFGEEQIKIINGFFLILLHGYNEIIRIKQPVIWKNSRLAQ